MAGRFTIEAVFKGVDKFTKPVTRMQNRVQKFTRSATAGLRRVQIATRRAAEQFKLFGGLAVRGLRLAAGAFGFLVSSFSKIEDAQAAFQPILGSVEKAKELVDALNKTAATTPFQFETLAGAAKQLLPVIEGDAQNLIDTIRRLGDTAGGNAQKLESITRGFTKAMLKGKVDLESLNMIGEAGVPIFKEMAASMGITTAQLFKMITAGKVTTGELTKTFKKMTSEGGLFFKGMEIASATVSGKLSTLRDNVTLAAASIGSTLAPTIKEIIDELLVVAQNVGKWAEANKELIGTEFKKMVQNIRDFIGFVKDNGATILRMGKNILIVAASLKVLSVIISVINILMSLNPIVLVVLAVIAAISLFIVWIKFLIANWDSFGRFFAMVWEGIVGAFNSSVQFMQDIWDGLIEGITSGILDAMKLMEDLFDAAKRVFGLSKKEDIEKATITRLQAVNPAANILANMTDEERARLESDPAARIAFGLPPRSESKASATVTIKDETGRAEISKSATSGAGSGINLQPTGAF